MLFWAEKTKDFLYFTVYTNSNSVFLIVCLFLNKTVCICEIVAQRTANYITLVLTLLFF